MLEKKREGFNKIGYNKRLWVDGNLKIACLFILASIVAALFLVESPLHPWICADTKIDSSVFRVVAFMMSKGFMPYRDSFDHKGPLLYIINWLGNNPIFNGKLWIIEWLFLTLTIMMMYKIARIVCSIFQAILVSLTSLSLLFNYFEGGNLTEEYAMLFIAIAVYIFVDYLKNDRVSKIRLVICGASLGGTLLLRPNMIAIWAVMCSVIFFQLFFSKKWKNLWEFSKYFLIGLMLILVPVIIWLSMNHALQDFWKDYVVFNKSYIKGMSQGALWKARWNTGYHFFNTKICKIAFAGMIFCAIYQKDCLNISYLAYMIVSLILIGISGVVYGHYGMVLIPMLVYPLAEIFSNVKKIKKKFLLVVCEVICFVFVITNAKLSSWITLARSIPSIYADKGNDHRSETASIIGQYIDENTAEDEKISVYGNWDYIYLISERCHATQYSYQYPIADVSSEIMENYWSQLEKETPPIIVVQAGRMDDMMVKYLYENQYELLWSERGREVDGALIYKK